MKVGEIWEYTGNTSLSGVPPEEVWAEGNERVRILSIFKDEDIEIDYEEIDMEPGEMEDLIEFEHLGNGAIGILDRPDFITVYRKVYE